MTYRPRNCVPGTPSRRPRGIALGLLLAASAMALPLRSAEAQRRNQPSPEAGLRGGFEFKNDDWSAGAQLRFPLARGSELIPSGDWIFRSGTNFRLNLDLAVPLMPRGGFYGGGGLGVDFTDRAVSSGLATTYGGNLMLGVAPYKSGRHGLHWFAEGRWFLKNGPNLFTLVIGLNARLGG